MFSKGLQVWSRPLAGLILASLVFLSPTAIALAGDPPAVSGPQDAGAPRPSIDSAGTSSIQRATGTIRHSTAFPRADAGDDLIGLVGRRVTLNGRSSTPAGRIGFRWFQVEGPPVNLSADVGDVLTFLPGEPGTYRFALVVAEAGSISEPDFATVVIVAEGPGIGRAPAAPARAPSPEEAARRALNTLEDGAASARTLAAAFEEIAGRIDIYETYADVFQGTTSRLEPVLPTDPARRAAWNERLFIPLTTRLVDDLRAVGLDLSRPDAMAAPLSAAHRKRVAGLFRAMAKGFRSASPPVEREEIPEPAKLDLTPMKQSDQVKESDLGANGRVSP